MCAAAWTPVLAQGAPPVPPRGAGPSRPGGSGTDRLYPQALDPPDTCGVPLGGPFGKDAEVLLNDVQYELEPGWLPRSGIPCPDNPDGWANPMSDIAGAPLGTEKLVAVWRDGGALSEHSGELYYNIWRTSGGGEWGVEEGWLGLKPEGNPAVLATWGQRWEVYARDSGGIQYTAWLSATALSEWQLVPDTRDVASDPVVVSRRHGHVALFYRDNSGNVRFTEREGVSAWRQQPVLLTPSAQPPPIQLFLPIVARGGRRASRLSPDMAAPRAFRRLAAGVGLSAGHRPTIGLCLRAKRSVPKREPSGCVRRRLRRPVVGQGMDHPQRHRLARHPVG